MSGAMINQLVSALYLSTRISTQWHEHMITANRLLSVSFNGTYSHFLSKWIWLQLVVIIFVPLMPYAPTIGSVTLVFANIWIPAGFIYNVNSHLFQRKSSGFILDPLINYLSDITPLLCLMMLVLDIITLHNSHGRTKTSSLDIQQQRMDTRVSIQMLTLHLTNILYWIVNLIVNFQLASANFQYLLTIFSGTQYLIQGMLMTYFNWPIKGKGKFARVFTTKTA
ncbi:unnamed protein product, partial [Mesorhabditis belari]|uniref:Uncharacterized protein n=1 Tax=Mesorhabditis belari TaxID=2138241 RepID=A0AAF3J333_9BILA